MRIKFLTLTLFFAAIGVALAAGSAASTAATSTTSHWYSFIDLTTGTVDWSGLTNFACLVLAGMLAGLSGNAFWKEVTLVACKRAALAIDELRKSGQLRAGSEAAFEAAKAWARQRSWAAWLTGEEKLTAQMVEAVAVTPGVGATGKTPAEVKPSLAVFIALALLLGLASPVPAADVDLGAGLVERAIDAGQPPAPPTTAQVELSLLALPPAPHGHQNDKGVAREQLEEAGVVLLELVRDKKSGGTYIADPSERAAGKLALHRFLFAHGDIGVGSKWTIKSILAGEARARARTALQAAAGVLVREGVALPDMAPAIVRAVIGGLRGTR